jgi:hypothetical protein
VSTTTAVAIVLALPVPVVAWSQNLLENGDFSQWSENYPLGWWIEDSTKALVEKSTSPVRSPDYSVKLTRLVRGTSNNSGIRQQYIPVQAGEPYTLSAWVYDNEDSTSGGIGFSYYDSDTNYIRLYSGTAYSEGASPDWQLVSRTDTIPDSAAFARVTLRVYNSDTMVSAGGIVSFDDAEFVQGLGAISEKHRPGFPGLMTVVPNLSSGRTLISFALPAPGHTWIGIYDLTGSLRSVPFTGVVPDLPQAVSWDRTDRHGHPLPDGLYFVVLNSPGGATSVRKLTLAH